MSDVADKWGLPVAQRGFAQVPNYLLLINQFLDSEHRLSPTELLVTIQLVGSWWKKDAMPFPSMGTLATRCGVSSRQIQRSVTRLEKSGLIKRVSRRTRGIIKSNAYDLTPLTELLAEVAKAFPNEFPRNVDKATVERISAQLNPKPEHEIVEGIREVSFDDDLFEDDKPEATPKRTIKIKMKPIARPGTGSGTAVRKRRLVPKS